MSAHSNNAQSSLIIEIQKVHDFLYKELNDTKILLPLMLTVLDKYKEKKSNESEDPIVELKKDLEKLDRRMMEQTLQKIKREHSNINPLLERLINESLNAISPERLPEAKIERVKQRLLRADKFFEGLEREEDFIGLLFETLAAHSGVFDKKEGRFFTPKNIILTVVEMIGSIFEAKDVDVTKVSVCDPCCGSGRYLVHWANRIKREYEISDMELKKVYSDNLFGIDISPEVASWATWNMIFHGDGATNIENADSLNWYGFLVHWNLIQKLLEELPSELQKIKRIRQRDVGEAINELKEMAQIVDDLKEKNEIDLESEEVKTLFRLLDKLISLHHKYNIKWPTLEELSKRRDFKSISEIVKLKWVKEHPHIKNGFDLIITNPPFGRGSQDLMVTDPYILCQYKLATELWLGDISKELAEKLIEKQFEMDVVDFYRKSLKELKIRETREEYEIKFNDLPSKLLKRLAQKHGIPTKGKSKKEIVDALKDKLNREILIDGELSLSIDSLPDSFIKKLASRILYDKVGGKSKVGEFLYSKIQEKLGREWITVEDVYDYSTKLTIKDSATGDEHTIYYNEDGEPILFKEALPKQVVFLEEFLRFVKEGGYVFTVVDTGVLSNSEDEYVRRFLYRNSRIHAIVEFPHNAFKAAGTGVKTAVILYQKLRNPPEDYEIFGALPQHLGYVLNKQDTPPDPDHNDLGKVLCDWRFYLGLGRMCEPCKDPNSKIEECCDWYKKGYCPVWREKIERADL
ncbi:hypothetical protein A3L08_08040 [Thermococcus pacificus]|uniref:DNA methylase adenine-specific domain-containing protein n=2 Tax=Thermococcus pacificus TaxID=71998 RepID=A0A218P914_9EURY|nr:hypothetical protein A3L08_08040 [Thermococcus pacificus]